MKTAQDVQSYDMPGADHVMLVLSVLLFLLGIHRILPLSTCIPSLCMSGQLPNSDYEHLGLSVSPSGAGWAYVQGRVGSAGELMPRE